MSGLAPPPPFLPPSSLPPYLSIPLFPSQVFSQRRTHSRSPSAVGRYNRLHTPSPQLSLVFTPQLTCARLSISAAGPAVHGPQLGRSLPSNRWSDHAAHVTYNHEQSPKSLQTIHPSPHKDGGSLTRIAVY